MADPLHIILPADGFPPGGGAAWSSHALALALCDAGHRVTVVVPRRDAPRRAARAVDGLAVVEVGYRAPRVPFAQNYLRYERLWPRLAAEIAAVARSGSERTVIHAQHSQTGPAAVLAGRLLGVPSVVTVRDHWPWDYHATGLHGNRLPYPRTTWSSAATDLVARQGPLGGALALAALPYIVGHVRRRAALLGQASAVVAVSSYIAGRLAGIVANQRLFVIPNIVDQAVTAQALAQPDELVPDEPFLLFVGKLERNKGADLLPAMLAGLPAPPLLVVAGDGGLRPQLARDLAAAGVRVRLLPGWTDHDTVLRLMHRAEVLLFPSGWGEPLSRVLLEGCAVGACILALDTGGTGDVIVPGQSGDLVVTAAQLPARLAALLADPARRAQLRRGARALAAARFAPAPVVAQLDALYRSL